MISDLQHETDRCLRGSNAAVDHSRTVFVSAKVGQEVGLVLEVVLARDATLATEFERGTVTLRAGSRLGSCGRRKKSKRKQRRERRQKGRREIRRPLIRFVTFD